MSEAGEGGGGERGLVTEAVGRAAARVAAGTVVQTVRSEAEVSGGGGEGCGGAGGGCRAVR